MVKYHPILIGDFKYHIATTQPRNGPEEKSKEELLDKANWNKNPEATFAGSKYQK